MKKYKVNFEIRYIDLNSNYNQAVKFASDMMNEPDELSPYHITNALISVETITEPTKDMVKALRQGVLYNHFSNNNFVVKSINLKNIELIL